MPKHKPPNTNTEQQPRQADIQALVVTDLQVLVMLHLMGMSNMIPHSTVGEAGWPPVRSLRVTNARATSSKEKPTAYMAGAGYTCRDACSGRHLLGWDRCQHPVRICPLGFVMDDFAARPL